ncbi:PilC/PilY family type IV pilus protein [Luteimonas sp. FCS-9]|uniref:pilus assembly protein n=1 Tax=Luteimonas sp. FCS-9 TaxID=1547516 RepID=UPI00063EB3EB|nr:PilC/PilY family type IV pilus protein [Luteimonas sp. FCS-9]KLJ01740.1 pilus assembly protein [Luteimonas sp. FCS-9]
MALRRIPVPVVVGLVALAVGGYFIHGLRAEQGQGVLAQAPLNTQIQVPPAFIMAVDDSGSMTFHNQFPASDGYGCFLQGNSSSYGSFFSSSGVLRTSGTTCRYSYSYTGPRIGDTYLGIPPVDNYGFARSPDFNPSYFNPQIRYEPWIASDGVPYAQAGTAQTRIDPRNAATIALASNLGDENTRSRFQAYTSMFLPAGTEYRLVSSSGCGGLSGGGRWRTVGAEGHRMSASCALYVRYWPAAFFMRYRTDNDAWPMLDGATGVYTKASTPRTRVDNACGPGCHLWKYTIQPGTAALQNFANWYSFYGNRNRAMIAGMTQSMASVNSMRVGYFPINRYASYDAPLASPNERVVMRDMGIAEGKAALYSEMIALPASGGTPNRQAVKAAGEQFRRSDAGAPVQLACQRNATMLFTDGFSNAVGPSLGSPANRDGGMGIPFADGHSSTMADIAAAYYLDNAGRSPLRTDLAAGQVPVPSSCPSNDPRINCQKNLHVNFYGVTLGGRGNLYDPVNLLDPYTDARVYQNWPPAQDNNRSTVDDIWHATVNTRGELINARTPADITAAMRRILLSVTSGTSPSGSLAVSGARVGQGSLAVTPQYEVRNEGTDWFSRLTASKVALNRSSGTVEYEPLWDASARFPEAASRNVWVAHGGRVSRYLDGVLTLEDLCTKDNGRYPGMSRCTAAELQALGATSAGAARRYLLGDTSLEKRLGGGFRDRTTVLGDIVNSTPVVSAPSDDYGYQALPTAYGGGRSGDGSYGAYLEAKQGRRYMVYVGANDGMFHAFDGGMDASGNTKPGDSAGGRERFAYIPATAVGHLGNLLYPYDPDDRNDQKFSHRYYVDGPVAVGDARVAGTWKTVVVGASGAGGRSVFALDVSDPGSFDAADRLWEISDLDDTLDAEVRDNIGHVLGRPVIVPVRHTDGTVAWKAIFGNGYGSKNGKAVLFVVDIAEGAPTIRMIEAEDPDSGIAGGNGLGNLVAVDRWRSRTGLDPATDALDAPGSDGFVDTVYAADQKGAIWKFDLREPTSDALTLPLFTSQEAESNGATYRQPITGGLLATAGPGGGVMLYFGTGSFSFVGDPGDQSVQSLYAIVDPVRGPPTSAFAPIRPSHLVSRTILGTQNGVRVLSAPTAPSGTGRGWRLTLPAGERFVGFPSIASGVVFLPTYAPQDNATGCSTQGFNWLYGLNALTGAAGLSSARTGSIGGSHYAEGTAGLALDTGGSAPVRDVGVLALPRNNQGTAPPPSSEGGGDGGEGDDDGGEPPSPPPQGCWMAVTVAGADTSYLPYPCGRQSWRQIQ